MVHGFLSQPAMTASVPGTTGLFALYSLRSQRHCPGLAPNVPVCRSAASGAR